MTKEKHITTFKSDGVVSILYDHTDNLVRTPGKKPKFKTVKELFKLLNSLVKECKDKGRGYMINQKRK